jgi:hypothetical protein
VHQHQNFYHTAFSFQGMEAGLILRDRLLLGLFGSTFVTRLTVPGEVRNLHLNVWQAGGFTGQIYRADKLVHWGWLLNAGYLCSTGDYSVPSRVETTNSTVKATGMVLLPELYGELKVANWLKLRTGFGYSFYLFESQPGMTPSDLQNPCFTFGFLLGNFR